MDNNLSRSPIEDGCECKAQPPNVQGRNLIVCIDGASKNLGIRFMTSDNTLTAGDIIDLIEPILREPQHSILTSLMEHEVFRTMVVTNHIGDKLVTWLESNDQNVPETVTMLEALLRKYGTSLSLRSYISPSLTLIQVDAYELHADLASDGNPSRTSYQMNLAQHFKDTLSRNDI
ncbi:hypothetical protein BU17DRAFT_67221 [Hysterangium stoloniferum]|nr:hypothetical protein BU17DRAFT_67221 [Hysterangium stoloniferum]